MYRIEDIPIGRKNAISRKNLAAFWGVSDRLARKIVSELRTIDDGSGYVIVSISRCSGYYRTNNPMKSIISAMRWSSASAAPARQLRLRRRCPSATAGPRSTERGLRNGSKTEV